MASKLKLEIVLSNELTNILILINILKKHYVSKFQDTKLVPTPLLTLVMTILPCSYFAVINTCSYVTPTLYMIFLINLLLRGSPWCVTVG